MGLAPQKSALPHDARTPELVRFSAFYFPPEKHDLPFPTTPTSREACAATVPSSRHLEKPVRTLRKGIFESKSNHSPGRKERWWGLGFRRLFLSSSVISLLLSVS